MDDNDFTVENDDPELFESDPHDLVAGIRIRGLKKVKLKSNWSSHKQPTVPRAQNDSSSECIFVLSVSAVMTVRFDQMMIVL